MDILLTIFFTGIFYIWPMIYLFVRGYESYKLSKNVNNPDDIVWGGLVGLAFIPFLNLLLALGIWYTERFVKKTKT